MNYPSMRKTSSSETKGRVTSNKRIYESKMLETKYEGYMTNCTKPNRSNSRGIIGSDNMSWKEYANVLDSNKIKEHIMKYNKLIST